MQKIKKPNAFLMKIGFACCLLSWVVLSLAFPDNWLYQSFIDIPMPLLKFNAFIAAWPISCVILLVIFMPFYEDAQLSKLSKYVGVPLVSLFAFTILCFTFLIAKGSLQYKALFTTRYALQPVALSSIEEIYTKQESSIIYITSAAYPDSEVDAHMQLITENFPVYILHYSIDDDTSAYDVLEIDENIQEPVVIVIMNGEQTHCFFAQEIIDGNLEEHLRNWAAQNRYFVPQTSFSL